MRRDHRAAEWCRRGQRAAVAHGVAGVGDPWVVVIAPVGCAIGSWNSMAASRYPESRSLYDRLAPSDFFLRSLIIKAISINVAAVTMTKLAQKPIPQGPSDKSMNVISHFKGNMSTSKKIL